MMKITHKQMRFIDEFDIDSNGTQAAIRAGYAPGSARGTASRMLTKANIKAEIEARAHDRIEQSIITKEELLLSCSQVIRAKIPDYIDPETGELNVDRSSPNQRAIQSYRVHKYTDKIGCEHIIKSITLVAKSAYIEQAAKLTGIEKTQVDNEINVNIRVVGENVEVIEED